MMSPAKLAAGLVAAFVVLGILGRAARAAGTVGWGRPVVAVVLVLAALAGLAGIGLLYAADRAAPRVRRERATQAEALRRLRERAAAEPEAGLPSYDPEEEARPWWCQLQAVLPSGDRVRLRAGLVPAPASADRDAVQAEVVRAFAEMFGCPEGVAYVCSATPSTWDRVDAN